MQNYFDECQIKLLFVTPGSCSKGESINTFSLVNGEEHKGENFKEGFSEGNYWNSTEINADIVLRLKTRQTEVKLGLFLPCYVLRREVWKS